MCHSASTQLVTPRTGRSFLARQKLPGKVCKVAQEEKPGTTRHVISTGVRDIVSAGGAKLWLEGMGSYTVVAALLMNAAMRMYLHRELHVEATTTRQQLKAYKGMTTAFVTFCVVTMLASTFSMVVFIFMKLYGLQSLSQSSETARFLEFFTATEFQRRAAFRSFLLALYSFLAGISCNVYVALGGRKGAAAFCACAITATFMVWQWGLIMSSATKVVFG